MNTEKNIKRIKVLVAGSDLTVPGGISTVIRSQLSHQWERAEIWYIPTYCAGSKARKVLFFIKASLAIVCLIVRENTDIIHIHLSERGSFYRAMLIGQFCRILGRRVLFHHHGAEFSEFYEHSPRIGKQLIRAAMDAADINLILGEKLRQPMERISDRAVYGVLHNGVRLYRDNLYCAESNGILFLSCMIQRKGIMDLLTAIRELDPLLDKDIQFYLCGRGTLEGKVSARIREWKLDRRIVSMGWLTDEQKPLIYRRSALHILPSYGEGMPLSILETMAYGIPSIATELPGIEEVIKNGWNGWLFCPGDTEKLADLILDCMSHREARRRASKAAFETIRDGFDVNEQMRRLETYYVQLMEA